MKKLIEILSVRLNFSHAGFEKYLKNTLWLFGERLFTMGIGLFVGIAVARYLGPADYGIISYGLTLLVIATQSAALGIDDLIVRDALRHPEKTGKIFGTVFIFRATAALLFFIFCTCFAFFTTEKGGFIPALLIIVSVIVQPVNILSQFFQMKVNIKPMMVANIYAHVISAGLKIAFIFINAPVMYFAFAMFLDYFIAVVVAVYLYKRNGYSFGDWQFDRGVASYLFKTGWPLAVVAVLGIIYTRIDIILLNLLEGSQALGIYAVSVRLTEVWFAIPTAMALSLFPAIVNSKTNNDEYKSRIYKIFLITIQGALIMGLFVTFASGLVVKILYGQQYAEATLSLSIYIWNLLFVSMNVITIKWLMMENYIMLAMYRTFAGVIFSFVISYLLISGYGITGAAVASVVSYAFYGYFIDLLSSKTRGLFYTKTRAILFPFIYAYSLLNKK